MPVSGYSPIQQKVSGKLTVRYYITRVNATAQTHNQSIAKRRTRQIEGGLLNAQRDQSICLDIGGLLSVTAFAADPVDKWWPSEWGRTTSGGSMNRLTPAKVIEAALLITKGEIYDMGRVFEEDMPLFSLTPKHRKFTLVIPGAPTWGPMGENRLVWNDDYITGHLTQNGTQFDAFRRTWGRKPASPVI